MRRRINEKLAQIGKTQEIGNTEGKFLYQNKGDTMRKKTHEEFISQMRDINDNIEIVGKYEKDSEKIECKCIVCGYKFYSTPSNLLRGKGCKMCHFEKLSKIKRKPIDVLLEEIHEANQNIIVISYDGYRNNSTKLKCKCTIHDEIFHESPHHILDGKTGCKQCAIDKQIKKNNEITRRICKRTT